MKTLARCAIYARLSMDQNGMSTSVGDQVRECREHVARQGWDLVAEPFIDNDISATSGRPRPSWERLLALFSDHLGEDTSRVPDIIVCWAVDRLYRRPADLERIIAGLDQGRLKVKGLHSAEIDLSTPSGRAVARTLVAWDAREVEELQQRVKRGIDSRALSGDFGWGGARPFGYRVLEANGQEASGKRRRNDPPRRLELDPAEEAILRDLYAAVLDGRTLKGLARELNERGLSTTRGNRWTPNSLRQTLLAPRNAGLRVLRGEVVGRGNWRPVVDRRTWKRAVALLTDPARTVTNRGTRYLLSGLVYCECGARLMGRPIQHVPYYSCTEGPVGGRVHLGIKAGPLEDYVLERAWSAQVPEPTIVGDPAELPEPLLVAGDEVDALISRWNREAAKAGLTAAEIVDGRTELVAERQQIEDELGALATRPEPGRWERVGQELSRDPRAVVEMAVERVTVRSAQGRGRWSRVGDRAAIKWRDGVRPLTEDELRQARAEYETVEREGWADWLTTKTAG